MRDPFVTNGNNVIELAPRSLFHRRQRFAIREILASTMERGPVTTRNRMAAPTIPMRGRDVIEVPKAMAKGHMACNNLVLDDQTVVVPAEDALDPIANALEARRFEVPRIPYRVPCMAGGSFRCAHQPLIRL